MSDTPETDEAYKYWPCENSELVDVDFARKLERERDKAAEDATNYYARIGELEKERDEALDLLAKITKAAEAVIDRWEQPAWKDTEPTGAVIYRLRDALGREAE